MSFDEYVNHISQKYRLAVAISVIKTKPNELSVEEYLKQLQNKIKNMEYDANETVCSDDFNFDDDEMPFDKSQQNTTRLDYTTNETRLEHSVNENDSQSSQTILNDFVFGEKFVPNMQGSSIGDTIKLLKEVASDVQEKPDENQNLSQTTFCESQEANTNNDITYCYTIITNPNDVIDNNKNNNENNNMDSQETQLYSLHDFTQNYTHISQSQGDHFVISEKYIRNKAGDSKNVQDIVKYVNRENDVQTFDGPSHNLFTLNEVVDTNKEREAIGNSIHTAYHKANDVDTAEFRNTQTFQFNSQNVANEHTESSKTIERVIENVVEYVENANFDNTQMFQFNVHNDKADNTNSKKVRSVNNSTGSNKDNNNADFDKSTLFDSQEVIANEFTAANNIMENIDISKSGNIHYKNNQEPKETPNNQNNLNNDQLSKEINVNNENKQEMEVDETDSDDNLEERVPFKVVEELNRVKTYLNKKERRFNDGYSTDSGYRSDSQPRNSLKSLSQSGAWLNQSAHCLLTYLVQMTDTDDIVKEIAQVLGLLIDKLHEEENYPPFLEEMLETVDGMLRDIHGGGSCADDVLVTKDENIQRLILLNKSKHIIKHSIEKITTILEKLHTDLTQETLYELTNIVEVENICYIFHVLEIFLKRYMKIKDESSQNTQNSQEDIFPKRSSLTELWRKKWNPNCKEVIKSENKPCILKRCRDILNKIIVECMDGYSLVAFAALQCFNLIQV